MTTYMAIPYEPKSFICICDEGTAPDTSTDSLGTFVLVVQDEPCSLLCFAGINAFKGFTVH